MPYQVEIRPAARRQIKKLPREVQAEILARLTGLADNPRPLGAEALEGSQGLYRLRSGQYRVIYSVEEQALLILVVRVAHRREAYRQLGRMS